MCKNKENASGINQQSMSKDSRTGQTLSSKLEHHKSSAVLCFRYFLSIGGRSKLSIPASLSGSVRYLRIESRVCAISVLGQTDVKTNQTWINKIVFRP